MGGKMKNKEWISVAYIPSSSEDAVLIIDIENRRIRKEPLRQGSVKINNFKGKVFAFSSDFLKELNEMAVK